MGLYEVKKGFVESRFKELAARCDNAQLKKDVSYMRVIIHNGSKIYAETLNDSAFFVGYHNIDHLRLVCIGTVTEQRGKGFGRFMLQRAIVYARAQGYTKIKTRTNSGVDFYQKWGGGRIVGMSGNDYLMEIDV